MFTFKLDHSLEILDDFRKNYFLDSDNLWDINCEGNSSRVRLNEEGVPIINYPLLGDHVNPAYVAWWGLININNYHRSNGELCLKRIKDCYNWLANRGREENDCIYWDYTFDWPNKGTVLKAPWYSGMAQALIASFLYRVSWNNLCEESDADLAVKALNCLKLSITENGCKTELNGYDYYEEYPIENSTRVLDGSLFIVLALYDYYLDTGDKAWFKSALEGISSNLSYWDCCGIWSWYGNFGYTCTNQYHALNTILLSILGNLSNDQRIKATVQSWSSFENSLPKKVMIFCTYYISNSWYTLSRWQELKGFIRRKLA